VFAGQHSSLNSSDSCNYQPPSTTINHHQPPSTTINHHQPPSATINHHQIQATTHCVSIGELETNRELSAEKFFLDFDFSSAAEPIASIEIGEYQSGILVGNNSRYLVVI